MNRTRQDFYLGCFLAVLSFAAAGCKPHPTTEPPRFKNNPLSASQKSDPLARQTVQYLPTNRQADALARQSPRPPSIQPANPSQDIQRSLKTVEEINRMNRLNQQLRLSQPQKR